MALTFEDVQNSGLMGDQSTAPAAPATPLSPNTPPSASAPPYTPPPTTFGFNQMGVAMKKAGFGAQLAKKMDENPAPPEPGGWAKSILASAQQVLSGVGDISTTPTNQPESKAGSFFEGLSQTIKNRNEREQNQKQQEFENQRKLEAEKQKQQEIDQEKLQSDSVIAHNNIENMHTLRLIHDMGTDQVDKQIARDAVQVAEYKEDDPTSELYSDMSKEDIYKKMEELQAKDPHDPNHPLVLQPFMTRQIDTGKKDNDGNPVMDTKYSLFRIPEKRKLGDNLAKAANKYGLQGPGGTDFSADDELFGHQINTLTKQITMAQTAEDAVNKLGAAALSDKEAKEVQETIADQKFDADWIKILDAAKKNSTGDVNPNSVLYIAANGIKDAKGNVIVPPVKNANDVVAEKFGGRAAFDKMLDYQNKIDVESERVAASQKVTDKAQEQMEKQYADRLDKIFAARSGSLGIEQSKVSMANHLSALVRQVRDPKTGDYNVPAAQYEELARGLAQLISPTGTVSEQGIENLKTPTGATDIRKLYTYITGQPANGNTQALINSLVDSIDRQGQTAVKNRDEAMLYQQGLAPTDLDPVRKARLEQAVLPVYHQIRDDQVPTQQAPQGAGATSTGQQPQTNEYIRPANVPPTAQLRPLKSGGYAWVDPNTRQVFGQAVQNQPQAQQQETSIAPHDIAMRAGSLASADGSVLKTMRDFHAVEGQVPKFLGTININGKHQMRYMVPGKGEVDVTPGKEQEQLMKDFNNDYNKAAEALSQAITASDKLNAEQKKFILGR